MLHEDLEVRHKLLLCFVFLPSPNGGICLRPMAVFRVHRTGPNVPIFFFSSLVVDSVGVFIVLANVAVAENWYIFPVVC